MEPRIRHCSDGTVEVEYLNQDGRPHREDGPASIRSDGTIDWCINGLLHRENGPARIRPDGTKEWYRKGRIHRLDGPAIEHPDGEKEYWINAGYVSEEVFNIIQTVMIDGVTYQLH